MNQHSIEQLERHIKTHSERSADDRTAVSTIEYFLNSDGKINYEFSSNDKWPNTDGKFEIVPEPEDTRQPKHNFFVQIKGTQHGLVSENGSVKYQLKSLAFPAYIAKEITLDPGILFLAVNLEEKGKERVFWKYMSPSFISSIDFDKDSCVIEFTKEDEIENTKESIDIFTAKLKDISDNHLFIKQLDPRFFTKDRVEKIIITLGEEISEIIRTGAVHNDTRDNISKRLFRYLRDICETALLLNAMQYGNKASLRIAWEIASLSINTKFLCSFLQGLHYIGFQTPEEGQYERLILKYYDFLWRIRDLLKKQHNINILNNLEDFPVEKNEDETEYNNIVATAIKNVEKKDNPFTYSRYIIQKKSAFYIGKERFFEITLQLANKYATKYNRLTVYSDIDISSNYSIQIGFQEVPVNLWDSFSSIKVVTNWRVSIEPTVLNKFSKLLRKETRISSVYNEYNALMNFLTETGLNLVDFIDFKDNRFKAIIDGIYREQKKTYFKDVLIFVHERFNSSSNYYGTYIVRYVLLRMRESVLDAILPENEEKTMRNCPLLLSSSCYSFLKNPVLYNLPYKNTNGKTVSKDVVRVVGKKKIQQYYTYIRIKYLIDSTGELYFPRNVIEGNLMAQTIEQYNSGLEEYDKQKGLEIKEEGELVYLNEYVLNTTHILQNLLEFTETGNIGQENINKKYIENLTNESIDDSKKTAIENVFIKSKLITIYGAAGTGKTTLMNYISSLMSGRSKLFLTKTHTALENLKRRIDSPGQNSRFINIDKYINYDDSTEYDIVFVDECSTIDNRTMSRFLNKISKDTLLVLAGDIYQIESIDFGNWFFYAKDILPANAVVELSDNWRTQQENLKSLWEEVRFKKPFITEKLVIDGPFSENINSNIFKGIEDNEVVLCLNYDGKFGLNSINNYFQDSKTSEKAFKWREWKYKKGDPILFNDNKRFPMLYNNLKGRIVDIESDSTSITFTIDVDVLLTSIDVRRFALEVLGSYDGKTRIRFSVFENDGGTTEEEREDSRINSIVPFQLAYAVSIHKAQGLEYDSIKVIIPNSNSERITHGVFYTAITRAKEKLKLYWSTETMTKIVKSFDESKTQAITLEMIKKRLEGEQ